MFIDEDVYLEHYGVKGMKWGQRKAERESDGASRKVDREARKDAAEFARAKQFYGDGAGTRRKLIKAKVEDRSKRVPGYKNAFDRHSGNQDVSRHVDKAISERKRTDRIDRTKKQSGAVARKITGEQGTQAAFAMLVFAGTVYLNSPAGRRMVESTLSSAGPIIRQNAQSARSFIDTVANQTVSSVGRVANDARANAGRVVNDTAQAARGAANGAQVRRRNSRGSY